MSRWQVGADVAALSASLTKPLRPLWVSQQSRPWDDAVSSPEELPFTPIVLVSASLPNARQRMSTGAWFLSNFDPLWLPDLCALDLVHITHMLSFAAYP